MKYDYVDPGNNLESQKIKNLKVLTFYFQILKIIGLGISAANYYWSNFTYEHDPHSQVYLDVCGVVTSPSQRSLDTYIESCNNLFTFLIWQIYVIWNLWPREGLCFSRNNFKSSISRYPALGETIYDQD